MQLLSELQPTCNRLQHCCNGVVTHLPKNCNSPNSKSLGSLSKNRFKIQNNNPKNGASARGASVVVLNFVSVFCKGLQELLAQLFLACFFFRLFPSTFFSTFFSIEKVVKTVQKSYQKTIINTTGRWY